MTRPAVLVAGIQGVGRQEPLHETRQVRPRRADEEMKVIAQQDIGKQMDIGEAEDGCASWARRRSQSALSWKIVSRGRSRDW